jgi:hypothetical protein
MTLNGALGDDMGNSPQDDLTTFAETVREAYLTPPDEVTEARHLAAMVEQAPVIPHEAITARSRARGLKEELVTRFRMAAPAAKLAGLTVIAAAMTGGLATAGVIDVPDSLPGSASDRADAVHEAIDGVDASETHPGTLIEAASGQSQASSKSAEAKENGADGAGQAFGDSVSDRASGGEPKDDGGAFGESVSGEAKELVDHPEPTTEPQGSRETGDTQSQTGQETGETQSQTGQNIAESHGGGKP